MITVAAQKLIWPQTKTYPKNAAAIVPRRRITPVVHVAMSI